MSSAALPMAPHAAASRLHAGFGSRILIFFASRGARALLDAAWPFFRTGSFKSHADLLRRIRSEQPQRDAPFQDAPLIRRAHPDLGAVADRHGRDCRGVCQDFHIPLRIRTGGMQFDSDKLVLPSLGVKPDDEILAIRTRHLRFACLDLLRSHPQLPPPHLLCR